MSRNLAATSRARLKQHADAAKQNVHLTLARYGLKRRLHRLSISSHAPNYLLNGALLLSRWYDLPHRWQAPLLPHAQSATMITVLRSIWVAHTLTNCWLYLKMGLPRAYRDASTAGLLRAMQSWGMAGTGHRAKFFTADIAPAGLESLRHQESIGCDVQRGVMGKAAPTSSLMEVHAFAQWLATVWNGNALTGDSCRHTTSLAGSPKCG